MAKEKDFDAAILDMNIRGGRTDQIALQRVAREIPFVLARGYSDWALLPELKNRPRLNKPFTPAELEEQVRLLCAEVRRKQAAAGEQNSLYNDFRSFNVLGRVEQLAEQPYADIVFSDGCRAL